jgi:preprotein translocase subunit YajC
LPDIVSNPLMGQVLWFALLIGIMYFLMIRPQQKEQKARAEMIRALKPGDRIVTYGGIAGVITKVDDVSVKVRIAEKVEVDVFKSGVGRVLKD